MDAAACSCLKPTAYSRTVDRLLRPTRRNASAIDLFSGAGGLALGLEAAGFAVEALDFDASCQLTHNANLRGKFRLERISETTRFEQGADLLVGGPPCQPFSRSGNQHGSGDPRNGLPAFLAAAQQLRPTMAMWENVANLRRHPDAIQVLGKGLEKLGYRTETRLLDAADYGVPQRRLRLIGIATVSRFRWPDREPGLATAGAALGAPAWRCAHGRILTPAQEAYVSRYEAISGCRTPRDLHPDRPARTLTCRNLAGATSDMMRIRTHEGLGRRLSVREAARLQSFPDWFRFPGSEGQAFRQIGNAVPPRLSLVLAKALIETL